MSQSFHFDALRTISGRSAYTDGVRLEPNCSNLARAILDLGDNPKIEDLFLKYVEEVFPSVKWVTASNPVGQGYVEVKVSTVDRANSRRDQLIPLSECGTGVGQVMAILLAALTFEEPNTIFIDEPNSFLHPSAAKKLIEILKRHQHHQYILTTHSSEILAAAEPAAIHQTRWTGTESVIETSSYKSLRNKELVLADLGVTMSDVFGANAIVWVEGMTEQLCFPMIFESRAAQGRSDVKFIGLRDVGSFDKSSPDIQLLWDGYQKLCQVDAITPPTVGFCFDREGRSKKIIDEIMRVSADRVKFLPRRNYESFLLHPHAISHVISSIEYDEPIDSSVEAVSTKLLSLAADVKVKGSKYWNGDLSDPKWLAEVDGASLLGRVFGAVTNSKLQFNKVSHSTALTDWILLNDRDFISELTEFVLSISELKK